MDIEGSRQLLALHGKTFDLYFRLLVKWNKAYNLTAITKRDEVFEKHFIDSLAPLDILPAKGRLLDIGAGAGFPGIPLKIVRPSLSVTLLDAVDKKCLFCEAVVRELGLKDIDVVHGRAEDKAVTTKLGKFDVVISRATFKLPELVKMAVPYLKDGGKMIAMKGSEEISNFKFQISNFSEKIVKYNLPGGARRSLFIISRR
jgi:16S rRNA (guanine527-N7)-methyltransferase